MKYGVKKRSVMVFAAACVVALMSGVDAASAASGRVLIEGRVVSGPKHCGTLGAGTGCALKGASPVKGLTLCIEKHDDYTVRACTRTNGAGRYRFRVPEGYYWLGAPEVGGALLVRVVPGVRRGPALNANFRGVLF